MLWSIENLWMSDTIQLSRLIEFLGSISMADVSSTNLTPKCQSAKRLFVIIVKSITPSLVPWGTPPLRSLQSDSTAPILTACFLSVRNAAIQLMSARSTSSFRNSVIKMLWSIRSKPSRGQRGRPGLLDQHNLLPRKWLVTCIEEHLLSSGLYAQTVAGRFFHAIVAVVYCRWIPPWLLPVYTWAISGGDRSLFLLVGLPSGLGWRWKSLEEMGCIPP